MQKRRDTLLAADRDVRVLEKLRDVQPAVIRRRKPDVKFNGSTNWQCSAMSGGRRLDGTPHQVLFGALAHAVHGDDAHGLARSGVCVDAWLFGQGETESDGRDGTRRGTDVDYGRLPTNRNRPRGPRSSLRYDDVERSRGVKARDLEFREQSVDSGLERIRFEQRKLTDERDRYALLKTSFEKVLNDRRNNAIIAGRENMRLIWENIKPKQAKEQILQMIDEGQQNEVVAIMATISITKRAKIIGEFKTEDESKKLEEILRLVREGVPDVLPIDQTREELKKFNPKQPPPTQAN